MTRIQITRRRNFKLIAGSYDSQAAFGRRLKCTRARVGHLISGHKTIGERAARGIEEKLGLPTGTLDK